MASYISYLPCIINSSVFFGSNIPSVVTDISMRFWPPSLQIWTQMYDSDQSFPSLKLVSLSASTELMLRSCSGLWTPLMVWVVKGDATCYGITVAVIYYLFCAVVVWEASKKIQIPDLEGPRCCWWGSVGEVSNESLKWGEGDVCGKDECGCG